MSSTLPNVPSNEAPAEYDRELDKFFKALSDHTRRSILLLLGRRQLTVGEIVRNFELTQPTISRHLSVLKRADLVIDRRHGQHVIYQLNTDSLRRLVQHFFGALRSGQGPSPN